jgi:PAS domain S-box-containing protein
MPEAKRKMAPGREASADAPLEAAFKLVASLPVPVFFKSRDGRYLGVNRAWEEFFGISGAAFVGKKVAELYPQDPAIAERHARMDDELYAKGGGQSYEIAVRTRSGELRNTIYYKSTIAGPRGAPAGLIGTIVDITDRKRAEAALRESEEHYRHTFELAGSGVAHIGLDRRFMRVNRRLCEILGYSEAELLQLTGRRISHPDDLDVINAQRPLLYAGKIDRVHVEKRYVRKDGSTVWVAFSMVVERDAEGRPLYEIAIFDDITARKQAEAALREAHEELKRSNSDLEQFAYVASHDLQEPLRMVSSYTQLIQRRYGDKLDGDASEFMHYVVDGAARMKQLIEDLLAYSRVGTKGGAFRDVEIEAALGRAVTNLRAAIEESGAAVTWDPLPRVRGDDVQLAQLFQNLIGNALKFRGASAPRVHVSCIARDDAYEFVVADNGIGIEPQYFERIFMVFQRLHTKGDYPGTGIGLAICKKVVERHGGAIWVSSQPGEGSQFHFTLPKKNQEDA